MENILIACVYMFHTILIGLMKFSIAYEFNQKTASCGQLNI